MTTAIRSRAHISTFVLALALVGGAGAAAHAADADAADTGPATRVSGVLVTTGETVTTAPAKPPLISAYTEGTITSDQVRNLSPAPMITVQTMLNNQPSIFAYTDGPLGTGTNIYLRAFNSGQFSETYDGVALNDVFNAGVTNQASVVNNVLLLPINIDSVEIYRGINNPAVNSYNSLGGTINYLPRQPSSAFGATLGGSYGTFNTKEFHASINTGDLFGLKSLLTYSNASSDGWTPNTSDRNTNVFYSGAYDNDRGDHLGLIVIYNHNNGYTPFETPVPLLQQYGKFYQFPLNWSYERDRDRSWMSILDFRIRLAPNVSFQNKFFMGFDDYQRTSYSNPDEQQSATQPYDLGNDPSGFPFWLYYYPNGPYYDPGKVFGTPEAGTDYHFYGYKTWGVGYSPTMTISLPHNTLTLGGNVTYGALNSREFWYGAYNMPMQQGYNDAWDEFDKRFLGSAFIQDDIKLFDDRLTITPGVKYIYAFTSDFDSIGFYYPIDGHVRDDEHFVSPTIGVNYKITDTLAVYAAFGRNVKLPDISAYYGAFQTDSNGNNLIVPVKVTPEYVNDYEAGVRYQQGGFSGSLSVYREDFANTFITSSTDTGLSLTTNGGSSRYQGVELQLLEDFGQQTWGDVKAYFNFAYNQAKFTSSFTSADTGSPGTVLAGQPLADVPNILTSGGVTWTYDGWRVDANGRYVGRQYLDQQFAGTPTASKIPGYFVADIGVSKTFQLGEKYAWAKSVRIGVNANNLFNKYYYNQGYTTTDYFGNNVVAATPAAPRSVTGSLEVAF